MIGVSVNTEKETLVDTKKQDNESSVDDSSDYDDGASLFRTQAFWSPKDTLPVSKIGTPKESYDSGDSSEDEDLVIGISVNTEKETLDSG